MKLISKENIMLNIGFKLNRWYLFRGKDKDQINLKGKDWLVNIEFIQEHPPSRKESNLIHASPFSVGLNYTSLFNFMGDLHNGKRNFVGEFNQTIIPINDLRIQDFDIYEIDKKELQTIKSQLAAEAL